MQNSIKKHLMIMLAAAVPSTVLAGGGTKADAYLESWGSPTMEYCKASDLDNATIGNMKNTCKGSYDIGGNKPESCVLIDDMGVLMLVARQINENGARFCVTTVYADKKKKKSPYTMYSDAEQAASVCMWLCKPGFSGEGCQPNSDATLCDTTLLRRSDFDKYTMKRDPNLEDSIAMFKWDDYASASACDAKKSQEHDMILAISDWLESGHGAWARPFIVRANSGGHKTRRAGVEVWPVTGVAPTLLCKSGYKANDAGNDCVPIDVSKCGSPCLEEAGAALQECVKDQLGPNWPAADFDEATMIMEYNTETGQYQYRCKEKGYAFESAMNRTCVECAADLHGGMSPVDGTCIRCSVSQIFDLNASDTGFCAPTNAYSKTDLQYGKGKTRADTKSDVSSQCWAVQTPSEYKECVTSGGIKVPTTTSGGGDAARAARRPIRR